MKYRTHLLAYVLVIALFFAAGYGAGTVNGRNRAREEFAKVQKTEIEEVLNTSAEAEEEKTEYTVILENSRLVVYESADGDRTKLTECEISESVYPKEDIAALKAGMVFGDKSEAMAMFENFAS